MKLGTFRVNGGPPRAGIVAQHGVLDAALALRALDIAAASDPLTLVGLLEMGPDVLAALEASLPELARTQRALRMTECRLLAPIPHPPSLRDFYAFEQHVRAARARRGLDMIAEWYEFPVFYFSHTGAVYGPDEVAPHPRTDALDFELEIACVIGRSGIDIPEAEAEDYIAGYAILNDWSARDVQAKEMRVGLGPAKGKDFAVSLGPWLTTPGDLADRRLGPGRYDLPMIARINGRECSRGNFRDITWTFPQMIARASQDVWLRPGDVLGSGTVGTGCLLEIGADGEWLRPGDVVELEIAGLGVLRNTVGPRRNGGER
ncbi:MAG: fumarylacetoacetate hydrolase family protein [Chloroflexi bacterium]|nr:fumarylacetoacetate hydrolase family protein [Chloroflexota bacterium]